MEGTLIAFRLARYDKDRASELVKRLYGQRTSSHGGRYVYRRKGLLDEIPHVRLIRGVIIVRTEDAERVEKLLRASGAEVMERRVTLTTNDARSLSSSTAVHPQPRSLPAARINEEPR